MSLTEAFVATITISLLIAFGIVAAVAARSSKDHSADRMRAIDACVHSGGRAVVSRDGWWCEKPGALP